MVKAGKTPSLAVGYIRASTEDQQLTLEAQRTAIERHCEAQGLTLADVYVDAAVSGGSCWTTREGLLGALQALSDGAGVLVIAKWDRLARDVKIACAIESQVEKAGARIESADGCGNGATPEEEFMRGIIRCVAQYERSLIRARTKAALAAKKARGERVSYHFAFGHTEAEQLAIVRMKTLHGKGLGLRAIARQLAAEGFKPRGKQWHAQTVRRVLAGAEPDHGCADRVR